MLLRPRYRKYAAFLDAVSAGYLTRLKAATGKTLSQDSLTPHVWRALLADVRVLPTDRAFQFMKYKFMEIPFCRKRVYPLLVDQYGRPVYADIGSTPLGWRGDRDLKRRKVKLIRRYKVDHSLEFFFNRLRSRELARRRLVFCRSYRLFDAAHRLYPGGVRVATTHKAL